MKIEVVLFGKLAERIGRQVAIDLPDGATVAELRAALRAAHPEIADELARPSTRACVDQAMVPEDFPIPARGEIAFLPPLSGG